MRIFFITLLSACLLTGCILAPYHVEVPQGNLVSKEMLAQLEPGMTPEQVKFIMGTPVLNTDITPDEWLYYYRNTVGGQATTEQTITLTFKDGLLSTINGESEFSEDDL
ncbi:outer membrane protein assembly factor BamE [Gynuella sunshinyii]|nr:outer membrane protein assembly factor BamE [Gynuella sunshinyii]